jgi:hypothetical protein
MAQTLTKARPVIGRAFGLRSSDGIAKLLAACRRVLLVCKLRHHLDGVFCPEAERVSSGVSV